MRKLILIITSVIFTILLVSMIYLGIYGIKTDNFNAFINNKVKDYNSNLTLQLDDVFVKLNPAKGSINIKTDNAILLADNSSLKIFKIDINLNTLNFIKKKNSIKKLKIETSEKFFSNSVRCILGLMVLGASIFKGFNNCSLFSMARPALVSGFFLSLKVCVYKKAV